MVQLISELNKVNGYSYDDSWKLPTFSVIISILTAFKPDIERQGGSPARFVCHNQTSPRLGSISNVSVNTHSRGPLHSSSHFVISIKEQSFLWGEEDRQHTRWRLSWTVKLLNNINCPAAFSYLLAGSVTCVTTSSTTVMISCHVILTAGDTVPLRPRQSRIRGLTSDLRGWLSVTLRRLETVRQDRRSDEREVRMEGVQEEREILITTPSGTSALLQTWSKCFLIAVSFMTY